jgi:mRNA interferase MazF
MTDIPDKGDFVWGNFNPQSGSEQAGHRPALVVSSKIYHQKSKLVIVCPVTSNLSPWPWKVILPKGSSVEGAILTDQIRSIDRHSRNLKIIGSVDNDILEEVQAKIAALFSLS